MKNENLHNMLNAVLNGKEDVAQMHFHSYLKNKFPKIVGKETKLANEEQVKLDSNEE